MQNIIPLIRASVRHALINRKGIPENRKETIVNYATESIIADLRAIFIFDNYYLLKECIIYNAPNSIINQAVYPNLEKVFRKTLVALKNEEIEEISTEALFSAWNTIVSKIIDPLEPRFNLVTVIGALSCDKKNIADMMNESDWFG